jgi:hypothetical protein
MRSLTLIVIAGVTAVLSACGGADRPAAPPGSADNPLVAKPQQEASGGRLNEASAPDAQNPGYQELVERQANHPGNRFTPCLVSRAHAGTILGVPVVAPVEAPQGPTCIYRSKSGRSFVTVAVQTLDFDRLADRMRRPESLDVGDRRALCGVQGQPMLHVSLPRDRVLTISAPCGVAQRFAAASMRELRG